MSIIWDDEVQPQKSSTPSSNIIWDDAPKPSRAETSIKAATATPTLQELLGLASKATVNPVGTVLGEFGERAYKAGDAVSDLAYRNLGPKAVIEGLLSPKPFNKPQATMGSPLDLARYGLYAAGQSPRSTGEFVAREAMNPMNIATGVAMKGKAPSALEDYLPKKKPSYFEFGGNEKLRKLASLAKRNLDNTFREIGGEYEVVFSSKNALDRIPKSQVSRIQNKALDVLDRVPERTPASNLIEKIVNQSENLSPRELHSIKQDLFRRSKGLTPDQKSALMEIYDETTRVLGSDEVYGQPYTDLSRKYRKFITEEANYVQDNILDKFEKPTEEYLRKNNFTQNEIDAFRSLEKREGSRPVLDRVKGVNRTQKLKKYSITAAGSGAGATGTAYLLKKYLGL